METYAGVCHCGKVEFNFSLPDKVTRGLRCNCSICKRLGVMHSPIVKPGGVTVTKGEQELKTYHYDEGEITWYFCQNCSIYLFYDCEVQGRVNLGCVESVDTFAIEAAFCDGASF